MNLSLNKVYTYTTKPFKKLKDKEQNFLVANNKGLQKGRKTGERERENIKYDYLKLID